MAAAVLAACLHAGQAHLFRVECVIERGLPRVQLVGLPDVAAREARERLPSAFARQGLPFPRARVLVNLVPAQLPKRGLPLDLALAMAILIESGHLKPPEQPVLAVAELDLAGRLRPAPRGLLLAARAAAQHGAQLWTAPDHAHEASLIPQVTTRYPEALADLVAQDAGQGALGAATQPPPAPPSAPAQGALLDEVRGQEEARLALVLAAAGRHSLLLQGPPGTGKSMLAVKLRYLLPPPPPEQAIELACLESLHGRIDSLPTQAPFRAPHHTTSAQALLGGGRPLRPGELSRAHGGVLFLDELPEFPRPALEGLRQPLEEGEVRLQRSHESATFPAEVILVAARNPCPCGFASHPTRLCRCTPAALARYARRTSGPLLDRIDLFVEMGPIAAEVLHGPPTPPDDATASAWLANARQIQVERQARAGWGVAAHATLAQLQEEGIESAAQRALVLAADQQHWSNRAVLRCLRVARTLADLDAVFAVREQDVLQAFSFRPPVGLDQLAQAVNAPAGQAGATD